ncbi:MAG: hypothetical protein WC140_02985 [Bacteroidales bacterium]
MKKLILTISVLLAMIVTLPVHAQGRFGKDSAECIKYLSFYKGYFKQKNLKEASPLWRKAMSICPPQASQNMLIDGTQILRSEIREFQNNPVRRAQLLDTLLMVHQIRANTFPKYKAQAYSNMALDYLHFMSMGDEGKAYKIMGTAMKEAGPRVPISISVRYMGFANDLYKKGEIDAETMMNSFAFAIETMDAIKAHLDSKGRSTERAESAVKDIQNLFSSSGVADCESLVKLFTPRYNADPNNKETLVNIISIFSASSCAQEDLYLHAVEGLYKIEKSYKSAHYLSQLYFDKGDNVNGEKYLREAIKFTESNAITDASYYLELATILYKNGGNKSVSLEAAESAAKLDPEIAGKAYFLCGTIWAAVKGTGNEIEKRSHYWVAIDYLLKAKKADSTIAGDANKLIAECSQYFPKKSDAFMFDIKEGDDYTVREAGLVHKTIVRTQK